MREKLLNEILNTERTYVNDLKIIKEVYMTPLKESGIITPEQQKNLFANVEEIELLNRSQVLAKIESRFKEAEETGLPVYKIQLGDIFLELSVHLKHYTEYCSNQPGALAMLDELEKANSEFAAFTKNLMDNDTLVRGLSLLSFIIKPVQRLCKYPLLLRELITNSDPSLDPDDFKKLQAAITEVNKTVEFVNAMQREADEKSQQKLDQIAQIEASIEGAEVLEMASDKNRSITRIGDVTRIVKKKPQVRLFYLFNNLIVIASPKKKPNKAQTHKLDWYAKIFDVTVTDLGDDASSNIENGFELKSKSFVQTKVEEAIIICSPSPGEKRAWIKDIRTHIKDWQSREAKRQTFLRSNSNAALNTSVLTLSQGGTSLYKSHGVSIAGSGEKLNSKSSNGGTNKSGGSTGKKKGSFIGGNFFSQFRVDPPPDDGFDGWKQKQEEEKLNVIPLGTVLPEGRWNDWLQYFDDGYGIPFYYHITTKESTWIRPEGLA